MKTKGIHILLCYLLLLLSWEGLARGENPNAGLGPLEVRTQYPVTMPFLAMYPENTATIGDGVLFLSYSYTVANTIMNTEGANKQITRKEVKRGLVIEDFYDQETNQVIPGFRLYIDVESYRHLFKMRYGLSESTEISFELPFITYEGGRLWDSVIENWHDLVDVSNETDHGNFRAQIDRNRYEYYVVKDGKFIIADRTSFIQKQGEFITNFKWNLTKGGDIFPAISIKLSYKFGKADRDGDEELIASGGDDSGYYLLFSKGFKDWIIYFGQGATKFSKHGVFSPGLFHRFTTLEYRITSEHSFILQTLTQSSIFPDTGNYRTVPGGSRSFAASNSTDAAVIGYKGWWGDLFFETGFVEDYNQVGNETDIVIYFELGLKW